MKDKRPKTQFPVELVTEPSVQEQPVVMTDTIKPAAELTAISQEELIQLQLKYKDFQIASLQQKAAQQELEKAVEAARAELVKLNDAVNAKYRLDPAKDRINLQDGTIARGQ
jgi:hypothetical protein